MLCFKDYRRKACDITGVPTQTWELLSHPENDYDLSSLKSSWRRRRAEIPAEHVKQLDEQFEGRSEQVSSRETNALATSKWWMSMLIIPHQQEGLCLHRLKWKF